MKRIQKYTNEPLSRLEVIDDFLPPPEQLVLKEDGVKVTISLSKKSVDFFKAHAARSKVPYQRMIRSLLDTYADRHSDRPLTKRPTGRATKSTRQSA
jgi:predicted DNA binding CopG/RHH family protein